MSHQWISCDQELPPKDGLYEVCSIPGRDFGACIYDGFGFTYLGIYRDGVKYWRHMEHKKRYGKQT